MMGKSASKVEGGKQLGMADLQELLGVDIPEMPRNRVGRVRLIKALNKRFGAGFRSIPGLTNIIKEFDEDAEMEVLMGKIRNVKPEKR